jgi:F0F1-type ATP synthase gamma subunit
MSEESTTTTRGKLYNGVEYERTITTFTRNDGVKYRHIITDYSKGERAARVIKYGGFCSIGRQNAEMFQLRPTVGKARTYKHAENAEAKAIEIVLGTERG